MWQSSVEDLCSYHGSPAAWCSDTSWCLAAQRQLWSAFGSRNCQTSWQCRICQGRGPGYAWEAWPRRAHYLSPISCSCWSWLPKDVHCPSCQCSEQLSQRRRHQLSCLSGSGNLTARQGGHDRSLPSLRLAVSYWLSHCPQCRWSHKSWPQSFQMVSARPHTSLVPLMASCLIVSVCALAYYCS